MNHLYGIHDLSADWAGIIRDAGMTGWGVQSEGIGDNPTDRSGGNYAWLAAFGVTPIVRLNYSHHGEGTIPLPDRYDEFAERCANFVTASSGCTRWIIGNEPNLAGERCQGVPITPRQYADCFKRCRNLIKQRGLQHFVYPAAVAPYNVDTGWCMDYWREMLAALAVNQSGDPGADGLNIHTYSRGGDPNSIYSNDRMDAPYNAYYNGFRAYRDFLNLVPAAMRGLPVYITETDQYVRWADTNSGWVRNAYEEIDTWNQVEGNQKIFCLALYRWENHDQWVIQDKQGVIDDFRAAVARGYLAPIPSPTPEPPDPTPPQPQPPEPEPPVTDDYLIEWDPRLDQRGTVLGVVEGPGDTAWHVTHGLWFDEQEAQGRINIFVTVLDEQGQLVPGVPVRFWNGGEEIKNTEIKYDPWLGRNYSLDFAMYNTAPAYGLQILGGLPSDILEGMGLGSIEQPHHTIHTAYSFTFQRVKSEAPQPPIPPLPAHTQYVIALAGANLRAEPVTGAVMVAVPYGDAVMVEGSQQGSDGYEWRNVIYEWYKGWIRGDLLSAQPPAPPTPPVEGALVHPLPGAIKTQRFYQNPKDYAIFSLPGHDGTDFGGKPTGTPILAMADGRVIEVTFDAVGYGHYVRLYHPQLAKQTLYCHASKVTVAVGDLVKAGQTIALVGSTGNSTGPHLHLEVRDVNEDGSYRDGAPMPKGRIDPETWAFLHGLTL